MTIAEIIAKGLAEMKAAREKREVEEETKSKSGGGPLIHHYGRYYSETEAKSIGLRV